MKPQTDAEIMKEAYAHYNSTSRKEFQLLLMDKARTSERERIHTKGKDMSGISDLSIEELQANFPSSMKAFEQKVRASAVENYNAEIFCKDCIKEHRAIEEGKCSCCGEELRRKVE